MRIVFVTGMSGAGKRTAIKFLEDAGYYCVDNLPVELVVPFLEIALENGNGVRNIAMCVDARAGESILKLNEVLKKVDEIGYRYELLFLDADDEVLVKRYKETRRNHPLAGERRIMEGIELERREIAFLKSRADYIIDTTNLLARELKQELSSIFEKDEHFKNLMITILSFGFKYGIPEDADLVFDVRFLPNPYYIPELKPLTGNDYAIREFVMSHRISKVFLEKLTDMVEFLLPNYVVEGKNRLVIAIGCTGGKHRSVTLANELYKSLNGAEYGVKIEHRDITLDEKRKK